MSSLGLQYDGLRWHPRLGQERQHELRCRVAVEHAVANGFSDEVPMWQRLLEEAQRNVELRAATAEWGQEGHTSSGMEMVTAIGSEGQHSIKGSDGRVRMRGPPQVKRDDDSHCIVS
jgi:hypothetical protein